MTVLSLMQEILITIQRETGFLKKQIRMNFQGYGRLLESSMHLMNFVFVLRRADILLCSVYAINTIPGMNEE